MLVRGAELAFMGGYAAGCGRVRCRLRLLWPHYTLCVRLYILDWAWAPMVLSSHGTRAKCWAVVVQALLCPMGRRS